MKQVQYKSTYAAPAVIATVAAAFAMTAPVSAQQATTYRSTTNHAGEAMMPKFVLPVVKLWHHTFQQPVSYPLIADGMIYVAVDNSGTMPNSLYALDEKTGSIVWGPKTIPLGTVAGLAFENHRVFACGSGVNVTPPAKMVGYDGYTGAQLWATTLPGQSADAGIPTAQDGYVYAQAVGQVAKVAESDGSLQWSTPQLYSDGPVTVFDGSVFVAGDGGDTYSLSPATGNVIWSSLTGATGGGSVTAAYYDDRLYVPTYYYGSSNGDYGVLSSATGSLLATFSIRTPGAFDNGLMIAVKGNYTSEITALNLADYSTVWNVNDALDAPFTPPTIVNGIAYVGNSSGYLVGYDEKTGAKVFSLRLGQVPSAATGIDADMAAGDGTLAIPAGNTIIAVGDAQ